MATTVNWVSNIMVSLVFSKVVNAIRQEQTLRERLVNNIVGNLFNGVTEPVVQRVFEYCCNVDKDVGDRVEKGVRAGSL
ncbi:MAG: katA2 [Mycobacterium sp.]|jgi:catalase|nr:katA2 [Mycobacterium sp.]